MRLITILFKAVAHRVRWGVGAAGAVLIVAAPALAAGSWATTVSPNPGPGSVYQTRLLSAVAASSAKYVWAVGSYSTSSTAFVAAPLLARWTGTGWHRASLPAPASGVGSLSSVSAPASNDVWAAGWQNAEPYTGHSLPWVLHYNGSAWHTVTRSGLPASLQVKAVHATTASNVWLAGQTTGAPSHAVTAHWNGSAWRVWRFSPSGCAALNGLVTLPGTPQVIAAGSVGVCGRGIEAVYVLHWNGSSWSRMSVPSLDGIADALVAPSASSVWLTGTRSSDVWSTSHALLEHWNGHSWGAVTAPAFGATYSTLSGIAAHGRTNLLAVGWKQICNPSCGPLRTLGLHYNGSAWSVIGTPNPVGGSTSFDSFAADAAVPSSTAFWAVGNYGPVSGNSRTLAARYQ
jgi:hypothetical protein